MKNKIRNVKFGKVAGKFVKGKKTIMNLVGPVGSGKDFACYYKLINDSKRFNESKFLIIKEDGFEQFIKYFCNDYIFKKLVIDINNKVILLDNAEFQFVDNIDSALTLNRLLCGEYTSIFFETANAEEKYIDVMLKNLTHRIGRFPSRDEDCDRNEKFIKNPPYILTNGYKEIELKEFGIKVINYLQPNADSPDAENQNNLPVGYYDGLLDTTTEDYKNNYLFTNKNS